MGKLTISGSAEREVTCDVVDLSVRFHINSKKTSDAVGAVMEQCEQLLRLVADAGVKMEDIHIGENSVYRDYDEGFLSVKNGVTVDANRKIVIRLKYDMAFVNRLMEIIQQQNFSVDLHCDYVLTDREKLHTELLKEAVADSQKKAAAVAEVTGQRIIGIDSMGYSNTLANRESVAETRFAELKRFTRAPRLSDDIAAPVFTERESVNVVWLIE